MNSINIMLGPIDHTAFVEASKSRANLAFQNDKQQAKFELGVSMMVYKWNALEVAVVNSWGGPASAEKRDWMTAIVVDLFKNEKIVDVVLIEDTLLYAMEDEFETNVEDDSALPIAAGIIELYKQCDALDFTTVEQLYSDWKENEEKRASQRAALIIKSIEDSSSDDEDGDSDEDDLENGDASEMEVDDVPALTKQEPVIDDDGFELVQKKGRRGH
ncbi:LAMI_0H01552g1_1 [Lachancea mirantina]|uniref:LAMI_0H01552g1_1 n=1 Tax=Lachancea mirantina TaxID=1230905 RepID=A0A1G4KDV4_9SACH|nr:LAMI_0H01552g1_1 [Lachancea mirantina]